MKTTDTLTRMPLKVVASCTTRSASHVCVSVLFCRFFLSSLCSIFASVFDSLGASFWLLHYLKPDVAQLNNNNLKSTSTLKSSNILPDVSCLNGNKFLHLLQSDSRLLISVTQFVKCFWQGYMTELKYDGDFLFSVFILSATIRNCRPILCEVVSLFPFPFPEAAVIGV